MIDALSIRSDTFEAPEAL